MLLGHKTATNKQTNKRSSDGTVSTCEGFDHPIDLALWTHLQFGQPVVHSWAIKGCGRCCPVCGKVHIKDPFLLIGKSSLYGDNRFPVKKYARMAICLTSNCRGYENQRALEASLNKISFPFYISDIEPWLTFANRYYVRQLSTDGQYYNLLADGFHNALAIDFDYAEDWIYLIDNAARRVLRMHTNGTGLETVIWHDLAKAEGIAVDWIGRSAKPTF